MAQEGTLKSPGSSEVTEVLADDCCRGGNDAYQWDTREDCEVRQILDRIADKWSLLVISLLEEKTMRFGELERAVDGISKRMLTVTLRHLERDGLVDRTVYAEVPPKVEYRLSPLGHTLLGTVQSLVGWTEEHQIQIAQARAKFDAGAEPTSVAN
ncbi:winged helix-turn-helix transcriptional regulator [Aeromicrobium sp. Sec7.5]|uniref:winged helix-turn-helix transcriptional regulator n=1 Tax=Aeromicrobium sp. Sec7.5 TaxID=3121276 RepID=UPI002FE45968